MQVSVRVVFITCDSEFSIQLSELSETCRFLSHASDHYHIIYTSKTHSSININGLSKAVQPICYNSPGKEQSPAYISDYNQRAYSRLLNEPVNIEEWIYRLSNTIIG